MASSLLVSGWMTARHVALAVSVASADPSAANQYHNLSAGLEMQKHR